MKVRYCPQSSELFTSLIRVIFANEKSSHARELSVLDVTLLTCELFGLKIAEIAESYHVHHNHNPMGVGKSKMQDPSGATREFVMKEIKSNKVNKLTHPSNANISLKTNTHIFFFRFRVCRS